MKKVNLANEEHHHSSDKSQLKRIKQKNVPSHVPVIHPPQMSESALKRWQEARSAYLGNQHPHTQSPRRVKQVIKTTKNEETAPFFTLDHERFSRTDLQQLPVDETIHEHVDNKCVGTETNDSILFNTDIEQIDEAIQADIPSPQLELQPEDEKKQEIQSEQDAIEHSDKATETDLIINIKKEDEVDHQSTKEPVIDAIPNVTNQIKSIIDAIPIVSNRIEPIIDTTLTISNQIEPIMDATPNIINQIEPIIDATPNVSNQIEPAIDVISNVSDQTEPLDDDDDRKTILSSSESSNSIYEQLRRLRHRFKRVSRERRLLICLLLLYIIIMFGLLVVTFMLIWAYQERSLILSRGVKMINTDIKGGVARYGESCNNDNDCKRPFTCFKKKFSSGTCRCPLKYDYINNQCIGDLNALCTKDTDCQRYMLCSGMDDGTRRCHCQTLYNYDTERKQCRGDYDAPCQNHLDCQANLICNKTTNPSLCSCQVNYRYYPLVHKCRGDPGAICEQVTAECIDDAECRDGACECAFQFVPNEKKICVDPCPKIALNRVKIRYPGNCRRFIDCQQRTKSECPEMTIFNFRTQLCDYPKNVLDCR